MGFRDFWAARLNGMLERGRQRSTQQRVLGIPVAGVPGQAPPRADTTLPERGTGCGSCGRTPRPGESVADEWRVGADGTGELQVLCPECWQQTVDGSGSYPAPS